MTGFTCLHHACKNGHENIVHFLVNFGCNIWALDNDYHTALDIANLYDRGDIATFLDATHSKQEMKNPKVVQSLKEKATREVENNIKRYEKLQKEVDKIVRKQEKIREEMENDFKPPSKGNIFKTLTLKFRGNNTAQRQKFLQNASGQSNFSDLARGTAKRGIAKKIAMKQMSQDGNYAEPKDFGTSGRRTLTSLAPGSKLVQGSASDVMYLTNRENETQGIRPALNNVFSGMPSSKNKWKSDSDLLDSGIDETDNGDDEEEKPGIFNRPMLGKISFLKSHTGMAGTFTGMSNGHRSASVDDLDGIEHVVNGFHLADDESSMHGDTNQMSTNQMKDVPWEEEVIDDDDDATPLVRFLETCQLSGYLHLFTKEDIDLSQLTFLTDNDLVQLGLPMGPRRAIQHAIKRRQDVMSQPCPISDSFL